MDRECYPMGQTGCEWKADLGRFDCKGICSLGKQSCEGGNWGRCQSPTLPALEHTHCFDGLDNNCSGKTDFAENDNIRDITMQSTDLCQASFRLPNATGLTWRGIVSNGTDALYALADFTGTITLPVLNHPPNQPTTQPQTITFPGRSALLLKLHPNGTILWAFPFCNNTTQSNCNPRAIAYYKGSVFVAGYLVGSHLIGNHTITTSSPTPLSFVARIDLHTRSGEPEVTWASHLNSSGHNEAHAIAVGTEGVFIGGSVQGSFPLGPQSAPTSIPNRSPFLLRYHLDGTHLSSAWFHSAGDNDSFDRIRDIKIANNDEVVVAGTFTDWIYLEAHNADTKIHSSTRNGFVARLGVNLANGSKNDVKWFTLASSGGDTNNPKIITLNALALDLNDNVYLTGDITPSLSTNTLGGSFGITAGLHKSPNQARNLALSPLGRQAMLIAKLRSDGDLDWLTVGGTYITNPINSFSSRAAGYDLHLVPNSSKNNDELLVLGAFTGTFALYQSRTLPTSPLLNSHNAQIAPLLLRLDKNTGDLISLQPPTTDHWSSTTNPRAYNPTIPPSNTNEDWFPIRFALDPHGVDFVPINALVFRATMPRSATSPFFTRQAIAPSDSYLVKGIAPYAIPLVALPPPPTTP
jgi:hypothetical protein